MRPGHEYTAVLEPAGIVLEIELGLDGGEFVPPQTHLDIAFDQHPVRGSVVAGKVCLEIVLPPRQHHIAPGLDNDAVVKAFQMIGGQVPGRIAPGLHGV